MSIRESALSLISSISQSDYLRAVTSGGNSRRVTMANAAKAVVEGYSGSSLGGSQRTVKAAIDAMANYSDIIDKIAIKNTASGAVASFPDGSDGLPIPSLIADINPIQDLHGYDAPWVGGAGKNKLDIPVATTTNNGITFTVNSDGTIKATGTLSGASASAYFTANIPTGSYIFSDSVNGSASTYWTQIVDDSSWSGVSTSGSDVNFSIATNNVRVNVATKQSPPTGGLLFKPMMRLSGTDNTWQPYENICPISGWSSVDAFVRGINLWDEQWEQGALQYDGSIYPSTTRITSKNYIAVKGGTSICYTSPIANMRGRTAFYDEDKNFISYAGDWPLPTTSINSVGSRYYAVETIPSNAFYMKFCPTSTYGGTYNNDISLNYPSTDTSYHAYNPNSTTHTTTLPSTVYGGTLDVVSGELTVDRIAYTVGGLSWDYDSAGTRFITKTSVDLSQLKAPTSSAIPAENSLSSAYELVSQDVFSGGTIPNGVYMLSTGKRISVRDTRYTTASDFTTNMGTAQLVFELATPQTYQLTPQQIQTLLGTNNVWADSGDVEVIYIADTKLYVDNH